MDYVGQPDIVNELKHFAKNPFDPTEALTLDLLITFIRYDKRGIADLGQGIVVKRLLNDRIAILDDDKLVAKFKDKVDIMVDYNTSHDYVKYGLFANP